MERMMSGRTVEVNRDEDGEFTSDTRETIYDAVPAGEPVIASEIADETGLPRTTVNYHLNKLADAGQIVKKKFHERRVVWLKSEVPAPDERE